jgi:hypothetical protein
MSKHFMLLPVISVLLCSSCGNTEKTDPGKIRLAFQPQKDKTVQIEYDFSVNQLASGDITSFQMMISGKGETAAGGTVLLELKNERISMKGSIQGKEVQGSATGPDSLTGDAKLVAMPVFSMIGKSFRGCYTGQLDKKWEVQVKDGEIVDSTENKMQFFLRYPAAEVGVGESWEKEIVIKAGNKMNCEAKYTLKEIKGDTAVISMEGKLFGKGESFGNEFSMDGTLKGTFRVDVRTGWPADTQIDQQFTLKMGERSIPMNYSISAKIMQ